MQALDVHVSHDPFSHGQRVDFPAGRPRILTVAFTLLWFAGWVLAFAQLALMYRVRTVHPAVFALLLVGGAPAAVALLWAVFGKRESLIVTPSHVRIYRWIGPMRLSRSIDAATVVGLRAVAASTGPLSDFAVVRQFYGAGAGSLAIETTRRTVTVGHTLSPEASSRVIEQIRHFMPQVAGHATGAVRRRRVDDFMAQFMAATLTGVAGMLPGQLLLTDRPICFYDDSVVPRHPIDVSQLRPSGRVYLVPIDDFPIERATAIAAHFKTTFGVAIEVAPAVTWPQSAYVESRRQMNSAVMLSALESLYATAGANAVAIGLTTQDMFNPDVSWGYVFSYRRNRAAVVSPARMDRGCMGVFPADDERIMTRLRKMVGKNIGLLYFGLGVSRDPASMLYGNVGGPQELDAMGESF